MLYPSKCHLTPGAANSLSEHSPQLRSAARSPQQPNVIDAPANCSQYAFSLHVDHRRTSGRFSNWHCRRALAATLLKLGLLSFDYQIVNRSQRAGSGTPARPRC